VSPEPFRRLLPDVGGTVTAADFAASLDLRAAAPADRPYVLLNMIASLDGRITVDGRAGPLANRADHELFHALRGAADAVLVGAGTVRAESYGAMAPIGAVVSHSLDLSPQLGLLRAPDNHVVVLTDSPDGELEPCAARVDYLRIDPFDLGEALRRLRFEHGVRAVVCEGGANLNAELLPAGLVDELHLVLAPLLVGGAHPLTIVTGPPLEPPLSGRLATLLESGEYLFARYEIG